MSIMCLWLVKNKNEVLEFCMICVIGGGILANIVLLLIHYLTFLSCKNSNKEIADPNFSREPEYTNRDMSILNNSTLAVHQLESSAYPRKSLFEEIYSNNSEITITSQINELDLAPTDRSY